MPKDKKKRLPVVTAKDEAEFTYMLSFIAFDGFLRYGRGVVVLKREQMVKSKDGIKCEFDYHPLKLNRTNWAPEAQRIVESYDPCKELILDVTEPDGSGSYTQSRPKDNASSPQETYRTGLKEAGQLPIVPGTVVRFKAGTGFEPGLYVFVGDEKGIMRLVETAIRDGRNVLTDQGVVLPVKSIDLLEETGANLWEQWRDKL